MSHDTHPLTQNRSPRRDASDSVFRFACGNPLKIARRIFAPKLNYTLLPRKNLDADTIRGTRIFFIRVPLYQYLRQFIFDPRITRIFANFFLLFA
jgi:hypothetical protein